ncbi:MAG: SLBB domain-containing protein [Nitrospirae bacterium]|nr:SLBB domain-containing protein [Nitrospirota bacterium]
MVIIKRLMLFVLIMLMAGNAFALDVQTAPVAPQLYQSPQGQQSTQGQPAQGQQPAQLPTIPSQLPALQMPQAVPPAPTRAIEPSAAPQQPAVAVPSRFEQFISGSAPSAVSTELRQFGYDLFTQPPSTFAPVERVPVGPDYVLGPGDEIRIAVWGKIEGQWSVAVDRDGNITLPKIGVLGVTGLTFKELKEVLQRELSKYYTGFEMNVSMGGLRTIRVYVVGNSQRPGAYTISSLSTLVNALFSAGGPSKTGTLRDIQLKRNGKTVVHFDMYDFLLKGDKTKDVRVMPEDVIFIPPVGPLAGIAGNVKNPAIYELKGETRLIDLIDMAGGLTGLAFKGRIQVQRIDNHQFRTIFEGDLIDIEKKSEKNFSLRDSDLVKVFSVLETKNTVIITGAVANPGDYGVVPGVTKIRDVISLAGGLLYYASTQAELTRIKVTQAGPVTERVAVDLSKAMADDPAHNIALEINDYLAIRTVPGWALYMQAAISGEVKFPGAYTIKKGERLTSLIERAGGYTDNAYLRGAVFVRGRVRELQQRGLEEMVLRLERELLAESSVQVSTALSQEEIQAKKVELESKQKFVESLKKLRATGRMTVRLAHLRLLKGSEYDIELEDGDSLVIPARNSVINVAGAVMSQSSFVYSDKYDYKDYVEMAGGYSRYADTGNIYVLKVDGSARRLSRGWISWNPFKDRWGMEAFGEEIKEIEPGDTIVVPEKLERIAWLREVKDITQILMQMAVTAGVAVNLF